VWTGLIRVRTGTGVGLFWDWVNKGQDRDRCGAVLNTNEPSGYIICRKFLG